MMVVNPQFSAKTGQEIIAYTKANPVKLNYSSPGIGAPPHLFGEMPKLRAGIDIAHVLYKTRLLGVGGASCTLRILIAWPERY
jgi:tripartite-type tricarboxylate transporter receptor subunit TctC